ncbi:MAG: hypothetical protein DMF10_11135, partial [Verrucomicrobia bacterium]
MPPGVGEAAPPSERGKPHGRPAAQPGSTMPSDVSGGGPPAQKMHENPPNMYKQGVQPPGGAPPGEPRGHERGQAAHGQPGGPPQGGGAPAAGGPPQRGGGPPAAERSQEQPQHGKKKGEKESPPPGPQ